MGVGLRPGAKAAGRATDPLPATRLPSTLHEWCRYPCEGRRRSPVSGWEGPRDLVAKADALMNTTVSDPLNHVSWGATSRFRRYTPRMLRTLDIEAPLPAEPGGSIDDSRAGRGADLVADLYTGGGRRRRGSRTSSSRWTRPPRVVLAVFRDMIGRMLDTHGVGRPLNRRPRSRRLRPMPSSTRCAMLPSTAISSRPTSHNRLRTEMTGQPGGADGEQTVALAGPTAHSWRSTTGDAPARSRRPATIGP